MYSSNLTVSPPIYMVGRKIGCWRCGKRMPVIALIAPEVEGTEHEVCLLSEIVELPKDIIAYIQKRVPTFQFRYSKTMRGKYYANTCPSCGMLSGDFFLTSEPGAPFFPTCQEEAECLYLTELPVRETVKIRSGLSMGPGTLMLAHAIRIK